MSNSGEIAEIAASFRTDGDFVSAQRYGNGHINETFLASYRSTAGERRYIHQRINERIFRNVPALTSNITRVVEHVRATAPSLVPELIRTTRGESVLHAHDGSWWRTYTFVEGATAFEYPSSPKRAYAAARAFAAFLQALSDLDPASLHETIPGFHDTALRFESLRASIAADVCGRAREAGPEIDFCLRNAGLVRRLTELRDAGIARTIVTHNDTKINNVLIDKRSGDAICVIDLDTVMPGLALYDAGDLIRTATVTAAEDERELSRVAVRPRFFEAVARGFVEGSGALLSAGERESLILAGQVITFETGIRFLADYLDGDTYFRVADPLQNLRRARVQFAIVGSLTTQERALRALVPQPVYRPARSAGT